jgi:HEAT repeat protein
VANEDDVPQVPPGVERFVRQLVVANKAVSLYPPASEIPLQSATDAVTALDDALAGAPDLVFGVAKRGLFFEDMPVLPRQESVGAFSLELYNRRLALVFFQAGTDVKDILAFLTILQFSPEDVRAGGGFEAMMQEQGTGAVTVVETQVTLVEQSADATTGAEVSDDTAASDAYTRPEAPRRVHVELARIIGDQAAVRDYLTQRIDADGEELTISGLNRRFSELAQLAAERPGPAADDFVRQFAGALWALEPSTRRELLETEMLPQARKSVSLGSVIRRIDVEEITRMLAEGEESFDERRGGFTRALRNLVQVSHTGRQQVASAAAAAMAGAGAGEQTIREVVAEAAPTRLTVRGAPLSAKSLGSEAGLALRLIEHAPLSTTLSPEEDREVAALRQEAEIGVTDADLIAALVTLASQESTEVHFAGTMAVLEDSLDVLVARGEFETAAEAAMMLMATAKNASLTPAQHRRLESAISRFARPEDMRGIVQTLRLHQPGQSEYEAAEQLLGTLGALAIHPLLELLADEQDRGERKGLVDLISRNAEKYVTELSTHVSDNRWYFVRNVVAILGSTKSPAALGALERTLRHNDARVRRETIRALSLIPDRMAIQMLMAVLSDDDANNVQLAARHLGLRGMHEAVRGLEQVAKGEGRGNRENGPRVEAIEALGKIGSIESIPILEAMARKRSLIGAAKTRELRVAATAALAAIRTKGGRVG